jgi:MFS transporter, DHA3 family, macrolide efflux protein
VMAVAMPLGMVVVGPLADRFTVESVLVGSGLATFLVVAVAVALPSGRLAMRAARLDGQR